MEMSNGAKLTLKDVKHVPDIRLNLLSVAKLCDEGYDSLFSRDSWKLSKGSMIVARGTKCSNLYLTRAMWLNQLRNLSCGIRGCVT
jgi:hypothetical protein